MACLRSASAAGRGPAPGARQEGALPAGAETADATDDDDWLAEEVEGLLQQAAAAVGVEL